MAGTQLQVEGLPSYYASTLLASSSTPQNSLEGLDVATLPNRSECWAEDVEALYQWNQGSTATPDGSTVILPLNQDVGTPGRWFLVQSGDVPGAGSVVIADSLSDLDSKAAFTAQTAILRGLNAVDDLGGGTFRVLDVGGLTSDDEDILDLSGVHSPKQLVRQDNWYGFGINQALDGTTTTITATNTLTPFANTFFDFTANAWTNASSGLLTYNREIDNFYEIIFNFGLSVIGGSGTQKILVGVFLNGVDSGGFLYDAVAGRVAQSLVLPITTPFTEGDTVRMGVANTTDTSDIALDSGSTVYLFRKPQGPN